MKLIKKESPYLENPGRLNNIIAAIQVMGTFPFYKLDIDKWANRIQGENASSDYWKAIFKEHPEFFRIDTTSGKKASLVWRRANPKLYSVDQQTMLKREEYDLLDANQKARISRAPLGPNDIEALINTAINLHSTAIEHKKEKRWWLSTLSLVVAILAVVGSSANNYVSERNKISLKQYEVTFQSKRATYVDFMNGLETLYLSASSPVPYQYVNNVRQFESLYFALEPYLTKTKQTTMFNKVRDYIEFCVDIKKNQISDQDRINTFLEYRSYFRDELKKELFSDKG